MTLKTTATITRTINGKTKAFSWKMKVSAISNQSIGFQKFFFNHPTNSYFPAFLITIQFFKLCVGRHNKIASLI
jgi:hypothetical protein